MSPDPPSVSRAEVVADAGRTPGQALLGQMGGVSGLIYSALPVVILVPVSTAFGLLPALIAALSVAAFLLVLDVALRRIDFAVHLPVKRERSMAALPKTRRELQRR